MNNVIGVLHIHKSQFVRHISGQILNDETTHKKEQWNARSDPATDFF